MADLCFQVSTKVISEGAMLDGAAWDGPKKRKANHVGNCLD